MGSGRAHVPIGLHVHDTFRRRATSALGEDVYDTLQVFVIDRLTHVSRVPMTNLGERELIPISTLNWNLVQVFRTGS
jgi:hypothetical protein